MIYPSIFAYEVGTSVPGLPKGFLGVSEQDKIYSGSASGDDLIATCTYYSYHISTTYMDSTYVNLFGAFKNCYISSRYCIPTEGIFGVYGVIYNFKITNIITT